MNERTFRPQPGLAFTLESVERALDVHREAGLIRHWRRDMRTHGESGSRAIPLYWVTVTDGQEIALANGWEAYAFVCGLASARQAAERKAALEAAERRAAEIEQAKTGLENIPVIRKAWQKHFGYGQGSGA